jgi:cell shape-determining protein MreC
MQLAIGMTQAVSVEDLIKLLATVAGVCASVMAVVKAIRGTRKAIIDWLAVRFVTRAEFTSLDERLKALERAAQTVTDSARDQKHLKIMLQSVEALVEAVKKKRHHNEKSSFD